jgi:hypothetical protein
MRARARVNEEREFLPIAQYQALAAALEVRIRNHTPWAKAGSPCWPNWPAKLAGHAEVVAGLGVLGV